MIKKTNKKKETSLRTIVAGDNSDGGIYSLPTNNSVKFYGFYVLVTYTNNLNSETAGGIVEKNFCIDFIESKLSQYTDIYTGISGDIETVLRNILNNIYEKIYQERGFFPFNLCISFLKGDVLYFARIGNIVCYNIKDRTVEKIFSEPSSNVDVKRIEVYDGDYIFLCSKELSNCINKNEVRRYILYSKELENASKELTKLAERYGVNVNRSNIIIKFLSSNNKGNNAFFTNKAISLYIICLFLLGFFWILGDLARIIGEQKATEIFRKKANVSNIVQKVRGLTSWEKKYLLVFEGFSVPYDVAEGKDGKLYIVDDKENDIIVYDPTKDEIGILNLETDLIFPTAIKTTDDNIFVVDFSILKSCVYQFDYKGNLVKRVPLKIDNIKLKNPKSLDFDEEGNWFVCDRGNNRILKFDYNGRFAQEFRLKKFTSPNGIAYWKKGIIFYTSKDKNSLVKMNINGNEEEVKIFNKKEIMKLSEPSSITFGKNSHIFISDTGNNRILEIKPSGELIEIIDKEKLEGLESFPPKGIKFSKYSGSVFVIGSRTNNYNEINKNFCKGRLWQIIY